MYVCMYVLRPAPRVGDLGVTCVNIIIIIVIIGISVIINITIFLIVLISITILSGARVGNLGVTGMELLHCCHNVVTMSLQCCHTIITLLLHCHAR
jgi:hypothetical protein